MGILVSILLVIAAIIALLLLIALVVKKHYYVDRNIVINKSLPEVFSYVRLLKNQDNFSKWASMDPAMKKSFSGTDGTEGFVSAWEGNNKVGKGEQKIVRIVVDQQIDYNLHFIKPFEGFADAHMKFTSPSANETMVSWGMRSSMKYPMNIMLLFLNMEKMIGNDFSTGLSKLKTILESK